MRRPSPPLSAAIAPPPRRRTSGSAPATSRAPAARPTPPRSPGPPRSSGRRPPNHARRRSIALALLITFVIVVGYGGYVAYDKITGGDNAPAAADDGYAASTRRAMFYGGTAVGAGINLRNLRDQFLFRNDVNAQIEQVRAERANLERLLPTATAPQADGIRATMQTMDELMNAMAQWRDAIFLLRLNNVASTESAIQSAVAELGQQLETWNAREGT